MTPTQKATLDRIMSPRSTTTALITIASSFPGTPFSELLKMVAHFNQAPDCLTCKHRLSDPDSPSRGAWCRLDGTDEPENVYKFCAEWDPSPTTPPK
jgi:hypothetical protein